ncbi:MAG: hypothetical protein OEM39_05795, partial [Acidimicrobiia bacterium]|nr:hypothetical protein [Acidimicrobiia bacterium]
MLGEERVMDRDWVIGAVWLLPIRGSVGQVLGGAFDCSLGLALKRGVKSGISGLSHLGVLVSLRNVMRVPPPDASNVSESTDQNHPIEPSYSTFRPSSTST